MKGIVPWTAKLIKLPILVTNLAKRTGFFPMKLEFPVEGTSGVSTEQGVIWWCLCITEEVEWMGSTAVRYLMQ